MRDVRDVREPPMSLATAAGRVRMGFGPRMAGQRPSGCLPAAYRADTADDQLASAGLHSATPVAPWTWLGAVRIEGDAGGGGGTVFDWAYYSFGAGGTQSGWKIQWNTAGVIALNIFDEFTVGVLFNRSDAGEPDLTDTAELIMMAVHLSASGDVSFRAIIDSAIVSGSVTSNGIGATSPEAVPIAELGSTSGALAWAFVAGEVDDVDFLAMPRTFTAPRDYAIANGYILGRVFAGAEGTDIETGDIRMEGTDAGDYPLTLSAGADPLTKVSALA